MLRLGDGLTNSSCINSLKPARKDHHHCWAHTAELLVRKERTWRVEIAETSAETCSAKNRREKYLKTAKQPSDGLCCSTGIHPAVPLRRPLRAPGRPAFLSSHTSLGISRKFKKETPCRWLGSTSPAEWRGPGETSLHEPGQGAAQRATRDAPGLASPANGQSPGRVPQPALGKPDGPLGFSQSHCRAIASPLSPQRAGAQHLRTLPRRQERALL